MLVVEVQAQPGGGGSAGRLFPACLRDGQASRVQIDSCFGLGMCGIDDPVSEIDPDGSDEPFGQEVEGQPTPLLVVQAHGDAIPCSRSVLRFEEDVGVDIERAPVKLAFTQYST